jgi:hypothetical protein
MGFTVKGLALRVSVGFEVLGTGLGCGVKGLQFRVQRLGYRIEG